MDGEKVIEEMYSLRDFLLREQRKAFKGNNDSAVMALMHYRNIVINAIPMLKQQEAVEPTFKQGEDGVVEWVCGSCDACMYHIYGGIDNAKEYAKYCRRCGRRVKWE